MTLSSPPLVRQQIEIRAVDHWRDDIVVVAGPKNPFWAPSFWRLDPEEQILSKLEAGEGRRIIGVSTGPGRRYATVLDDENIELVEFENATDASRTICTIGRREAKQGMAPATANERFIFVALNKRIVVVTRDRVVHEIPFENLVGTSHQEQQMLYFGEVSHMATHQRELILGFDVGEFGGGAYTASIAPDGMLTRGRRIWNRNVVAMVTDSKGHLWVASGGAGFISAGLVRYDGLEVDVVLNEASNLLGRESAAKPLPKVRLPEMSGLSGMIAGKDGRVIIAARDLGFLAYSDSTGFEMLHRGLLNATTDTPNLTYRKLHGTPVGIVEHSGRLILATRFLGLLVFESSASGYALTSQIVFP